MARPARLRAVTATYRGGRSWAPPCEQTREGFKDCGLRTSSPPRMMATPRTARRSWHVGAFGIQSLPEYSDPVTDAVFT